MSAPPTGVLFYEARAKPLSTLGLIQPGAYYQFYLTGTTTLTNVYADGGLTTPLSQTPGTGGTTAASDGRLVPIYLNPATTYRVQLYSALGILLEDTDPYIPVSVPTQAQLGQVIYPTTAAETSLTVTPTNFIYPPGHVYRYGTNTTPGTTDMTAAMNTAASVCRVGGYWLQVPDYDTLLVSSSINITNCNVKGLGAPFSDTTSGKILANGQFDILTITQAGGFAEYVIQDLHVDGGNPSQTAGLTGDIVSLKKTPTAHPYVVSIINCSFLNAQGRGIYIERGGYTAFFHVRVLGCGSHALECFGTSGDECTSIRDYGSSQFGGCPNGYNIKLTECTQMAFRDTICEAGCGIQLNGLDNRTLLFDGVYLEFQPTPSFTAKIDNGAGSAGNILTVTAPSSLAGLGVGALVTVAGGTNCTITGYGTGTGGTGTYTVSGSAQLVASETMTATAQPFIDVGSAGIGLTIRNMFVANNSLPFTPTTPAFNNWQGVYYQGNSNIVQGPASLLGRVQTNSVGSQTVTTTSDVTVGQLTLSPGTYRLWGTVQTIVNSGGGSLTQLACAIRTSSSDSGLQNGISPLEEAAAQTSSIGASQDARVSCFKEVQVFASTTYYLRAHIALSGTITEGYNGILRAELIE